MNRAFDRPVVSALGIVLAALLVACGGAAPAASTAPSPRPPAVTSTAAAPAVLVARSSAAQQAGTVPAVRRALVLGGGGPTGRAFELGMLKGLRDAGVDVTQPDLIVGTSAGAVLGAQLRASGDLDSMYNALLDTPSSPAVGPSDPGFDPAYFQQTAQMINGAAEVTPALRIEVGKRALAAPKAMSEDAQLRFIAADLGGVVPEWPSQPLKIAAGDVSDGAIRFFDRSQNVPIEQALAASTAVPGRVAPITIGDRSYMDGFVGGPCPGGCWPNLDGAAGYGIVVVVTLGSGPQVNRQVELMRSEGSKIIVISPDAEGAAARGQDPFDLGHLRPAAEAGLRQADAVVAQVRGVWDAGAPATR